MIVCEVHPHSPKTDLGCVMCGGLERQRIEKTYLRAKVRHGRWLKGQQPNDPLPDEGAETVSLGGAEDAYVLSESARPTSWTAWERHARLAV